MRRINPLKAGISVGVVIALWHLVWVTLVAAGWAKPFMDFVLWLHFIQLQYELAPFAVGTAAALVALTFAVGLVFGWVFAAIWNWLASAPPSQAASVSSDR
ncbi:MAG TPA: hypothetical protein VLM18_12680 [Croceibacterium sp.]|nr:hypothetical protein [Croceibacterium sp.]